MRTLVLAKTIIFNGDDKLLVLYRSNSDAHRPGGFDFPGGKVETGEALVAAALREAMEESGLQLQADDIRLVFTTTHTEPNNQEHGEISVVWLGFAVKLAADQPVQLSHEHQRFDWLTLDEALEKCETATQELCLTYIREHAIVKDLQS